jgi:hypothetical protein
VPDAAPCFAVNVFGSPATRARRPPDETSLLGSARAVILRSLAEPRDTRPTIEAMIADGYRRMTPSEKVQRVAALTRALDELALADVRRRHPNASVREQELRVASRRLDAQTMRRAFGWDPEREGY